MSSIEPICGHNDRVPLHQVIPLKMPFTLNIFPINACNFRCSYCAQSMGRVKMKELYNFDTTEIMSLETLKKAVEMSKQMDEKYKLVSFMGHGEPLLHPQLPEMIRLVRDAEIAERIEIITNGLLLTPELSDKIIDAGVTNVRISLQGLSSEKYKEVSGVEIDFDKFVNNLKYFYKNKKNSNLFVKIMDCSLLDGEENIFYDIFDSISDRMYIEKVKPVYSGVKYKSDNEALYVDRYGNHHEERKVCPLPFFMLSIWPNGDVVPCDAIYKPIILGSVNKDSIYDLINSKELKKFQLENLKGNRKNIQGCNKCCAPDDVSHPKDVLDNYVDILIAKFS